ncbi:MAG TPA: hypothetical protein VGQ57_02320 [Polyangiaceae bacterium]|jgi:hypothetical protein|nr:hypothetical protein [Polyangiaceae bacterium]
MRSLPWQRKCLGLVLALVTATAGAQSLGPEGSRIVTNRYAIDLTQGPVLAGSRVVGLAGTFVAMADGTDGDTQNPASPAVRVPFSFSDVDNDLAVGLTFPGGLGRSGDFFNSGTANPGDDNRTHVTAGNKLYVFLNGAANLQIDRWGFGVTADLQQYSLQRPGQPMDPKNQLTGQIMQNHLQAAYAFADDQLVVGVGARVITLNVSTRQTLLSSGIDSLNTTGVGFETGFIWRPNGERVRIGAAVRTAASAETSGAVLFAGSPNELYLPARMTLPWDFSFGTAVELGSRPLNPRWVSPRELLAHKRRYLDWQARERERRTREALADARREGRDVLALERVLRANDEAEAELDKADLERTERDVEKQLRARYAALPRFHALVMSSFLLTGVVPEGVGIEGFLDRSVQRSGQQVTLSPRLAFEIEPIQHWLQTRAGFYFEPTRFKANADGGRSHATLGLDLKLVPWDVFGTFPEGNWWRLSGSFDIARDYLSWGVAVGVWH